MKIKIEDKSLVQWKKRAYLSSLFALFFFKIGGKRELNLVPFDLHSVILSVAPSCLSLFGHSMVLKEKSNTFIYQLAGFFCIRKFPEIFVCTFSFLTARFKIYVYYFSVTKSFIEINHIDICYNLEWVSL